MTHRLCIAWLRFATIATVFIGLVAAFASADATDGAWLWLFDLLDWPVDNNPASFEEESFALNAVLGGVMVGWGSLMYLIVQSQFAHGNNQLAKPMIISILAWCIVDSAGSLAAGLPGNIILNLSFLAIFIPPLARLSNSKRDQDR